MLLAIKIQIWIYIQDMYGTGTFFVFSNSNNYNQISRWTHISFKQMQVTSNLVYTTTTTTTVYFWIVSIFTPISDFTYI